MSHNRENGEAQKQKKTWESPKIVDVGTILEVTRTGNDNVRDNVHDKPPSYHDQSCGHSGEEVEI